ncbi:MAG: acyl-CoA dehydrogenase family protein [Polyangiales bacterium]
MNDETILAACGEVAATLGARSAEIERARRLPDDVVRDLARAGAFRMLVPRAVGGAEVRPTTLVEVIERVARADGAAGWSVMVGATSGLMAAFIDEGAAREVYADPECVACGVFAPMGEAAPVEGGHVVTGRWPFASGSPWARWRMGGAVVRVEGGAPEVRHFLFEASQTEVVDTWDVSGLRGTASHDVVAREAFVPASRSASLLTARPRHDGALYAFPFFGLLALGVSAVALGVARASLDAFRALAVEKKPGGGKRSLAERELVQVDVARAEAATRAARALVMESIADAEREARSTGAVRTETRALLRLAATHATESSARAVDAVYTAAGGSAIYAASPLQRHFRDVHVATQHAMVNASTLALAGRVLLGLPTDAGML